MDLIEVLQRARQELLDLSSRNRLISTALDSTRSKRLDIVDERSEEVFRLLVRERKALSFLPGRERDISADGGDICLGCFSLKTIICQRIVTPTSGCKPG